MAETHSVKKRESIQAWFRGLPLLSVLLAIAGLLVASLLYLTSYMTFSGSEWALVTATQDSGVAMLWSGDASGWSTIPILAWKLLLGLVGVHTHLPFELLVLTAHAAVVVLMFLFVRARSGELPALLAAIALLVLGSAAGEILDASELGVVGSVAFGLLTMTLLEGNSRLPLRAALATSALLGCVMSSSTVGLAFLAAISIDLLLDAERRMLLLALTLPTVGLGLFLSASQSHLSRAVTPLALSAFVAWGASASAGAVFAVPAFGAAILPILAALIAWLWYRQSRPSSWQLGLVVGLLVWFSAIGLDYARYDPTAAGNPRYVYVAVAFLLPLVAHLSRLLPRSLVFRAAAGLVFGACLVSNLTQLVSSSLTYHALTQSETAELQTVELFKSAPDMALDQHIDNSVFPALTAGAYLASTNRFGSPVPPATLESLTSIPSGAVNKVTVNLFGEAVRITAQAQGDPSASGNCALFDSSNGPAMDLTVPDGGSVELQSTKSGDAFLFLYLVGPPPSYPFRHIGLAERVRERIQLPTTGRPIRWHLRVRTNNTGSITICSTARPALSLGANVYSGHLNDGQMDPGWTLVDDPTAHEGYAAMATHATIDTYRNDVIGTTVVPALGTYDVWYRVRVADASSDGPEMTMGLWDDQAQNWAASGIFAPRQVGYSYQWIKVASNVNTRPGRTYHFIASFALRLGTDWYIDDVAMLESFS